MISMLVGLLLVTPPPPTPEAEIKAAISDQTRAWNAGDLDKFCSFYADDAVFVSPKGVTRGRAEVLDRYQRRYPDVKAMGTLSFEYLDVRTDSVRASVAAKWKLAYPDKPEATGFTLIVWTKNDGKWRLVQDASM
jgi:uncharacterized protein (TIGR02246 family)